MKKIVILGGGTGLPTLLRSINHIDDIELSAIVTVSDDGGSTGVLSKKFNIPAVGDLRRVISAMSPFGDDMKEIMEYRFSNTDSDLDGHTIGNLILTASIGAKKDFAEGIENIANILKVNGKIIPVSNAVSPLSALLENGETIKGESNIGLSGQKMKKLFFEENNVNNHAVNAILEADYVIFGIGSLYTSLIATIIYEDIIDALKKTKAKRIYFSNIFTQKGETDNMMLSDHVKAIEDHTFKGVLDKIIVAKNNIPKDIMDSYIEAGQKLVENDIEISEAKDLISINGTEAKHDESKIEKVIMEMVK